MSDLHHNLQLADQFLQRFKQDTTGHFIDGKFEVHADAETFENLSPIDNTRLGEVVAGTAGDMDRACNAADRAFPDWRDMKGAERKKLLHHLADKIVEHAEEIAIIESMDCGQPVRFMKQAAIRGAENFRFFADKTTTARDGLALYQPEHSNMTLRTPIGPIGVITPWNTPFMLSTWKIAPALAAGCTVVHKPAEFSPLTATLLAQISKEAGIPDGVWNMVHGFGEVVGKRLSEHPAIKAIGFVGETITGSAIMQQASPTLKRIHLELGGKNPVLVFDDADFDKALDAVVFMIYSLNGQRCTSSSRLLIQSGIRDRFIAALTERVENLKTGHPLDPGTEVGPLIHRSHFDKVMSYMDSATSEGATIAVGGVRHPDYDQGNFVAPTLFTDATNQMRISREEIFGPVLTVVGFDDEEEAIRIANDTPYGLAGYAWTQDQGRAMRLAHRLEAGMLWINSENNRNLPSPFGGIKMSGIGRDGGDYSFDFYMETKNVCFSHGTHKVPQLGKKLMGKLALAAKITHVPSMYLSELDGPHKGCRKPAIDGHYEIGRRCRELEVDTIVVFDVHWLVNSGYHINCAPHFEAIYTSNELPHFIKNMPYQYDGNTGLGLMIAERANQLDVRTLAHHDTSLPLEYGTLVPMRYMNEDRHFKVVSISGWCSAHSLEDSASLGQAVTEAIEQDYDGNVAILASGSLSHRFADSRVADQYLHKVWAPFYEQFDHHVVDMWQRGDWPNFIDLLPDYADKCHGEGNMHDTAMLLGALGWRDYRGKVEVVTPYFGSSGTGQINAVFPVE